MAVKNTHTQRTNSNHSTTHSHQGNRVVSVNDGHSHVDGEEETYEKIVGSLGEINDEGCADLDGVRFIVEDIAYNTETEQPDHTGLLKAMILGDVLNNPRFKKNYNKR